MEEKLHSQSFTLHRTGFNNIHDASRDILKLDNANPNYEFRVQAIIKRLLHIEKASVYGRIAYYGERDPSFGIKTAKENAEFHKSQRNVSNEELITWNVATHKYVCICQKPILTKDKCGSCDAPLRHRKLKDEV